MRMLSQYPWFHGMVSRANASQLVVNGGEGQYLVRRSKSGEGDFVLTFNYHSRAKVLSYVCMCKFVCMDTVQWVMCGCVSLYVWTLYSGLCVYV